jgi:glycerophosphoryl diester phosphodiesterase
VQIIGHRGARNEAPENTIPGFAHVVKLGLQAVEFDVRLARDGELVVIHDATVDRTTDCSGEVGSFTSEELASMDARAEHPEWPERCGIPALPEVLDIVDHLPRLLIEVKANRPDGLDLVVERVLDLVQSRGLENQVTVTSFDPAVLEIVQHLAPEQSRGLIGNGDSPTFFEAAQRLGCDQIDVRLATSSAEMMTTAREAGLRTVAWPCNSDEELAKACAWQPDMLTTDRPSWLQELMARLEGPSAWWTSMASMYGAEAPGTVPVTR